MNKAYEDTGSPSDAFIRDLLLHTRRIAIVGASTEPWRPSFSIAGYLKRNGYDIVPINPFEIGNTLHGESFHGSLRDLPEAVDLVNVFRRSDALEGVVDEAIEAGAPAVWGQIGVMDIEAARKARSAGLAMIMNRCISVDHSRLGIADLRRQESG
ncbi:CoA-binding protein [Agaricicola taiwanensis]|uniref:CoA-binding protein n=1 Tax=Agaricicola taiwanensis TaxID=591372 RepID=A0A8J2YFZ0_9RHOB|nr:CoA-binding protein [Agaricicola taiwanensis]GGE35679.1 CoA-binding protein [Agaricicola taiwanensis]